MADPAMSGPQPELNSLWEIMNPIPIKITQKSPPVRGSRLRARHGLQALCAPPNVSP